MKDPQIYRDVEIVLDFFMHRGWTDSLPKVWRFTVYPLVIGYILDMLSASADAYEVQEGRVENIGRVISNLRKIRTVSRQLTEAGVISVRQMDYLDRLYEQIGEQARKWRNSAKKQQKKDIPCENYAEDKAT